MAAVAATAMGGAPGGRVAQAVRAAAPAVLGAVCVALAWDELRSIDWGAVRVGLGSVTAGMWLIAVAATTISYVALGHYDATLHRVIGTGISDRRAKPVGSIAIAIGQTTGFGLFVGTLIRWKLLPDLPLARAASLTVAVTTSFLIGWSLVTAAAIQILLPVDAAGWSWLRLASIVCLVAAPALVVLLIAFPVLRVGRRTFLLPTCRSAARLLFLTAIDVVSCGLVLYALLPPGSEPDLALFLPAFLVALGAGLISGTPGGIGPFELTLAALLPTLAPEALAAAILSYRMIYFALPAAVAGGALMVWRAPEPARPVSPGARLSAPEPGDMIRLAAFAPNPESLVLAQGHLSVLRDIRHEALWPVGRAGQSLVALFEPAARLPATGGLMDVLAAAARAEDRVACIYKVGARTACRARRKGWAVRPIAAHYWLAPASFTTDGAKRAGLRRKLRHARAAGVTVRSWSPSEPFQPLPWAAMARVASDWARRRGGQRGFSMGRYDKGYLENQRIYLAEAKGELLGFASFHVGADHWALDLMRQRDGAADGTMALLIVQAVEDAGRAGIGRLSLSAAPIAATASGDWASRLIAHLAGGDGLARFKEQFAPRRSRLYVASPTCAGLLLAMVDLARVIRFPGPVGGPGSGDWTEAHVLHEEVAFEKS